MVLKLARSIILSTAYLNEIILKDTLINWMNTIYNEIVKKLSDYKNKINNLGFSELLKLNIIKIEKD